MKLENQVSSLELSKKLKELGVKQDSLFYWCPGEMEYGYEGEGWIKDTGDDRHFLFDHRVGHKFDDYDFEVNGGDIGTSEEDYIKWEKRVKKAKNKMISKIYSSFTVAELGEMLPKKFKINGIDVFTQTHKDVFGDNWYCNIERLDGLSWGKSTIAETEADARAKMLIYLNENKLITNN